MDIQKTSPPYDSNDMDAAVKYAQKIGSSFAAGQHDMAYKLWRNDPCGGALADFQHVTQPMFVDIMYSQRTAQGEPVYPQPDGHQSNGFVVGHDVRVDQGKDWGKLRHLYTFDGTGYASIEFPAEDQKPGSSVMVKLADICESREPAPQLQQNAMNFIHGEWSHIFHDNGPDTEVRICFDVEQNKLTHMDIRRNWKWVHASNDEMDDVEDSIKTANAEALEDPEGWGLNQSSTLPNWAQLDEPSAHQNHEQPKPKSRTHMKSTPTPWTHTGYTSEDITTEFGPTGGFKYTVTVPAGTRCHKLNGGSDPWVVDDLSFMGHSNGFMRHDADHYGIRVKEELLACIRPASERTPVDPTFYGLITSKSTHGMEDGDAAKLRRAGIEISEYNHKEGLYYARLSPEAREMAKDLANEFQIAVFPRFATDDEWLRNAKELPQPELKAELIFHKFWVYSDENDGRLTANSSAELDLRSEEIETIEKRLNQHAAELVAKIDSAGEPKPAAPNSNGPSVDM